ncbi:amidase [Nocardioides pacificus]
MPQPHSPRQSQGQSQGQRVHAFTDDALGELDAVGLAEALRAGRVSVREVVDAAIARARRVEPELNALAFTDFDHARMLAAVQPDRDGPFLTGVPSLLKDNVDIAGMPSLHGTDAFVGTPHRKDGDLARMWRGTGLVVLGKSQLSEFGFSAAAEHPRLGAVRNPWDTDRTAGASSAGSAAMVAAGVVPIAHANDGGGSIRIPASATGLVGLKPTRGRLAQDKLMRQMPVRIVSDGVVTRSVRDTAVFLREAELVYRALDLPPIGDVSRPGRRRLRIAVSTHAPHRPSTPEVERLTLETAELLESLGHQVEQVDVPIPDGFADDFVRYWALLATASMRGGRASFGRTWDRTRLDELTRGLDRHALRNAHRLPGTIRRLRAAEAISAEVYRHHDVLLTPTVSHETPRVGHLDPSLGYDEVIERLLTWVTFTPFQNVTGDPAVSLPLTRTERGLPQGMMLASGQGREALLLGLAYELEQASPWPLLAHADATT